MLLPKLDAAALPAWGTGKAARQELSYHLAFMFSHPVGGRQLWRFCCRSDAPGTATCQLLASWSESTVVLLTAARSRSCLLQERIAHSHGATLGSGGSDMYDVKESLHALFVRSFEVGSLELGRAGFMNGCHRLCSSRAAMLACPVGCWRCAM